MRNSTFNFVVAIFCAVMAVAGNQDPWFVSLNVILALANLHIGLLMYKRGM